MKSYRITVENGGNGPNVKLSYKKYEILIGMSGTMLRVNVTPSFAVNPPWVAYTGGPRTTFYSGKLDTVDNRLMNVIGVVEEALTRSKPALISVRDLVYLKKRLPELIAVYDGAVKTYETTQTL
jgi:hypothetical protein